MHHAFLFEGPSGVGKATTARALAQAVNCERPIARRIGGETIETPIGCGVCGACHKIEQGIHPDVITFDMTPKGLTERVRELIAPLGFPPHEGKERVVILDPADDLAGAQQRAEAANALLKTLEEPPPRTRFVLVTAQPRRLPVTVRSRCQVVRFVPLATERIEELLIARHAVDAATARLAADAAQGSLGAAIAAIGQNETNEGLQAAVDDLLAAASRGDRLGVLAASQTLAADRDDAIAAMRIAAVRLRQRLLQPEEAQTALRLALWRTVQQTTESLIGNVAPQLALEHLGLVVSRLGAGASPATEGENR